MDVRPINEPPNVPLTVGEFLGEVRDAVSVLGERVVVGTLTGKRTTRTGMLFGEFCDHAGLGELIAPRPGVRPTAPQEISHATRTACASNDLVVIVRGGGPASELTTFDHPTIAYTIAHCPVPVIMAVGHSIDHTPADLVPAVSVATPTAAAAWLIEHANARAAASQALVLSQGRQRLETEHRVLEQHRGAQR